MNAERFEEIRKEVARSDGGLWTYETEHIEALLAEVERLRKQNAELLEWNRYYLEVTKERRKEVAELREEAERWHAKFMELGGCRRVPDVREERYDD